MSTVSEEPKPSVIEAAGGIVERQSRHKLLIAIVRRERYGPEWTLPKGKRQNGESWEETASREVFEETGLKPTIIGAAGCTFYIAGKTPKIVIYWRMRLDDEPGKFTPNEETKELRWVSPNDAARMLTHREEIELLHSAFSLAPGSPSDDLPLRNVRRLLRRWLRRKPLQRLLSTIQAYEIELSGRANKSTDLARNLPSLRAGLAQARTAAFEGQLDEGWRCLLAVQRVELLYMSCDDLRAAVLAMRSEAIKLSSWRKSAVLELLGGREATPLTREKIVKAADLRDEHYHNEAYKDSLRRSTALILAWVLLLTFAGLLWMADRHVFQHLARDSSSDSFRAGFLGLLALVGLLGANVSAITDLPQSQTSTRIPEMVATFRVTILRLLIGSASSIFLFFVVRAGMPGIGIQVTGAFGLLVIAFASGFSERLVLRVIRSIVERRGDER